MRGEDSRSESGVCKQFKTMKYTFYSIIIPSYNRVDEVLECLESLKSTAFAQDKFEVIVVDDGSTDATIAFLKDFEQTAPYNFRYISQTNKGPGAARNAAPFAQSRSTFMPPASGRSFSRSPRA